MTVLFHDTYLIVVGNLTLSLSCQEQVGEEGKFALSPLIALKFSVVDGLPAGKVSHCPIILISMEEVTLPKLPQISSLTYLMNLRIRPY